MARKSDLPGSVIVAVIVLGLIGLGLNALGSLPSSFWGGVMLAALCIGAVVGAVLLVRSTVGYYLNKRAEKSAAQKVEEVIGKQMPALVRRRAQLVLRDAYGKPLLNKWEQELKYFVGTHIVPTLTEREHFAFTSLLSHHLTAINLAVIEQSSNQPDLLAFSDNMTPTDFEAFCADQLRRIGWDASVTMQSRDQGVDVIAEKNGVRIVIQAKLYRRPVGNKAVQEVAAGRAHQQADFAIVVTNHRYTQDAEQLAATNGVRLLHHSDLPNLDDILQLKRARPADAWFYFTDETDEVGPLSLADIKRELPSLPRRTTIYVWKEGFAEWKPAKDVPELRA